MKRIRLAFSVVLLAAAVITGTAPLAKAQTACPDYEFIAARGSGETSNITQLGMGALMFSTFQQLQAAAGTRTIRGYGVNYPAVGLTESLDGALGVRDEWPRHRST